MFVLKKFVIFILRDLNWSLNDYVRSLKQELRTWRAVYWRLWGDCHYLSCTTCNNLFPTHQAQWCFHHADQPQFFTMEHQRTMTFPIGRYPCCGERAYRFEVLCSESVSILRMYVFEIIYYYNNYCFNV